MPRIIEAGYESGVPKPLEPTRLREGKEVRIRVEKRLEEELEDLTGVLDESSDGDCRGA